MTFKEYLLEKEKEAKSAVDTEALIAEYKKHLRHAEVLDDSYGNLTTKSYPKYEKEYDKVKAALNDIEAKLEAAGVDYKKIKKER